MKKSLLLLLIFSGLVRLAHAQSPVTYGPAYHGLMLASDSLGHLFVTNKYGVIISPVDSLTIHTGAIIDKISKSKMKDKLLVVRVLEMHPEPGRTEELLNMTRTYDEVAVFLLQDLEQSLEKKFSKKELQELKEKKS